MFVSSCTPIGQGTKATDDVTGESAPISREREDDEWSSLLSSQHGLLEPPYNLHTLSMMREQSTELGQCIQTMVTNTVGFGFQVREKALPDELREKFETDIVEEKHMLDARLTTVHPTESLTQIRGKVMWDKQACGNGFLELIEDQRGNLVGVDHIVGHSIRITRKQSSPTRVLVPRIRPDLGYKTEEVLMWHRFRRYAQVTNSGGINKLVWFKGARKYLH